MTAKTMAEVLAEHRMSPQDYAYCICGDELSPEEDGGWTTHEAMEAHQAAALSAAGFGLVADAKAEALEDAADEWATRSETFLQTMQNMAASREYGHDDVLRYGAYSAEAQTTSFRLRTKAAVERNQS